MSHFLQAGLVWYIYCVIPKQHSIANSIFFDSFVEKIVAGFKKKILVLFWKKNPNEQTY